MKRQAAQHCENWRMALFEAMLFASAKHQLTQMQSKFAPQTNNTYRMNEIIGYMAASLTTLSFLPQAFKVIKTRDTKSISLIMYVMFSFGVALWLLYGILLNNFPILIANAVTLALSLVILFFKLTERKD